MRALRPGRRLSPRPLVGLGLRRALRERGWLAGPYGGAAVDLTAAPEADRSDPGPAAAPSRWIRKLSDYEWRETTLVEGTRYG